MVQNYFHTDATPYKGYAYFKVKNSGTADWTDFHFEIFDAFGYDSTSVSIYSSGVGYDPDMSQTGTITVNNPTGGHAYIDFYFPSNPVPSGQKAWFEFYTDNTSQQVPYFGTAAWPTPEPATLALMAAGGLAVLIKRRKAA